MGFARQILLILNRFDAAIEFFGQRGFAAGFLFDALDPFQQPAIVDRHQMNAFILGFSLHEGLQGNIQEIVGGFSLPRCGSIEIDMNHRPLIESLFQNPLAR